MAFSMVSSDTVCIPLFRNVMCPGLLIYGRPCTYLLYSALSTHSPVYVISEQMIVITINIYSTVVKPSIYYTITMSFYWQHLLITVNVHASI